MSLKYGKDREFQELASKINQIIVDNDGLPDSSQDRYDQQKAHVELLYQLEKKFKHELLQYQQAIDIYKQFIYFIKVKTDKDGNVVGNGNILTAQSYFRESVKVFSGRISKKIKDDDAVGLTKFDINSQMMFFIVERWQGKLPARVDKYYREVSDLRRQLIENNLPLAINRAKRFYRTTPKSHLSLLDLINICTTGLIVGIDKYTGPYSKVWRSVCIGRMVGFMIEEYSKTFIRMYPSDKQILYRANSLKHRMKIENTSDLTKAVNESFEKDKSDGKKVPTLPIEEHQIISLMNSSSYLSADSKPVKDGDEKEEVGGSIYDYQPDESENPEELLIKRDLMARIVQASVTLDIIERKIIKLKGVTL